MKLFGIKALTLALSLSLAPMALAETAASGTNQLSQETMRPGHPRPRPPRRALWECASRNLRGQHFVARDRIRQWAQQRAQDKCMRNSRVCRPLGCRAF